MKTILLVEDNPDDVFIMQRVFQKAHISAQLQVATDGKQAIDYLKGAEGYHDRERYPLPDLTFLDLKLPFLLGFQVLEWIRAQAEFASLRVIVLSSSLEDKDREKAHALKVPYLIKPPRPDAILTAIRSLEL